MSREFLMLVQESAFKTPVASPTVMTYTGTPPASPTAFYIRLDGSNGFTMRPRPVQVEVPYGGGLAIPAYRVADKLECKGRLTTQLYAGPLSQFLLQWASQAINTAQTSPWTTTEPAGDLASVSIYHAIQRIDGSVKRRVYLGCKVDSWDLGISEDSTIGRLSLDITGSTPQGNQFDSSSDPTAATFPAPATNQLPYGPYVWINASGGLTLVGAARTQFQSVRISSRNSIAKRYWASRFLSIMQFVGRATTFEAVNAYAPTPDDRTSYEGLTTGSATFELNNGTNSLTISLNTASVITTFEDQLPLNDLYTQTMTITNQWDPTVGSDLSLSFT
jgi:hypothetical protein